MVVTAASSLARFMLGGVRTTVQSIGSLPFNFQFLGFLFFLDLFLLFNAKAFFPETHEAMARAIQIYLIGIALVLSVPQIRAKLAGMTLGEFAITFLLWGSLGAVLFKLLGIGADAQALLDSASIGLILVTAFVVAAGEEILFRLGLPAFIRGPPVAGQAISAIVFGHFHWTAYGNTFEDFTLASYVAGLPEILFATMLGFVFGVITIRYRLGFVVAIALHAAWNLSVQGFI